MKFLTTSILFLTFIAFSSSCQKEFTCECDGSAAGKANETYMIKAKDRDEAKGVCEGYADNTGGLVVCTLK